MRGLLAGNTFIQFCSELQKFTLILLAAGALSATGAQKGYVAAAPFAGLLFFGLIAGAICEKLSLRTTLTSITLIKSLAVASSHASPHLWAAGHNGVCPSTHPVAYLLGRSANIRHVVMIRAFPLGALAGGGISSSFGACPRALCGLAHSCAPVAWLPWLQENAHKRPETTWG